MSGRSLIIVKCCVILTTLHSRLLFEFCCFLKYCISCNIYASPVLTASVWMGHVTPAAWDKRDLRNCVFRANKGPARFWHHFHPVLTHGAWFPVGLCQGLTHTCTHIDIQCTHTHEYTHTYTAYGKIDACACVSAVLIELSYVNACPCELLEQRWGLERADWLRGIQQTWASQLARH